MEQKGKCSGCGGWRDKASALQSAAATCGVGSEQHRLHRQHQLDRDLELGSRLETVQQQKNLELEQWLDIRAAVESLPLLPTHAAAAAPAPAL